jgi:hypothetical protein
MRIHAYEAILDLVALMVGPRTEILADTLPNCCGIVEEVYTMLDEWIPAVNPAELIAPNKVLHEDLGGVPMWIQLSDVLLVCEMLYQLIAGTLQHFCNQVRS